MTNPILSEHKKLLKLISFAESSRHVGDGWANGWVRITFLVEKMGLNTGWKPLVNLAKDLEQHGLVEPFNGANSTQVRLTDAGRTYLADGSIVNRPAQTPPLNVTNLHIEVQRLAGALVRDGHYRQAITDTFIGLDNYVKNKSEVKETGASLMQKVFSANKPVLRLSTETEEQTGFMMLFTGAMKAIRNQYAHNLVDPKSKEEALEWLGFASALFRLVDSSTKEI